MPGTAPADEYLRSSGLVPTDEVLSLTPEKVPKERVQGESPLDTPHSAEVPAQLSGVLTRHCAAPLGGLRPCTDWLSGVFPTPLGAWRGAGPEGPRSPVPAPAGVTQFRLWGGLLSVRTESRQRVAQGVASRVEPAKGASSPGFPPPGPPIKFAGASVEVQTPLSGGRVDTWAVPSAGYALVPLKLPDSTPQGGAWSGIALKKDARNGAWPWGMVRRTSATPPTFCPGRRPTGCLRPALSCQQQAGGRQRHLRTVVFSTPERERYTLTDAPVALKWVS